MSRILQAGLVMSLPQGCQAETNQVRHQYTIKSPIGGENSSSAGWRRPKSNHGRSFTGSHMQKAATNQMGAIDASTIHKGMEYPPPHTTWTKQKNPSKLDKSHRLHTYPVVEAMGLKKPRQTWKRLGNNTTSSITTS